MYLIQIFLPQYDNAGKAFSTEAFDQVQALLVEKYGGVTAYVRSPAAGMWKENETKTVRDDIFIYEVMTEQIDYNWWRTYREKLCRQFRQEEMVVRANEIFIL